LLQLIRLIAQPLDTTTPESDAFDKVTDLVIQAFPLCTPAYQHIAELTTLLVD
jgi:hypothetical protein